MADVAFEFGAFGYMVKPFDTNELLINLASALRRRDLEVARRDHVAALERTITRTRLSGCDRGTRGRSTAFPTVTRSLIERLS